MQYINHILQIKNMKKPKKFGSFMENYYLCERIKQLVNKTIWYETTKYTIFV